MNSKYTVLIASLLLAVIPIKNFAQNPIVPSLGSASSFVLFTSSGTIINAGTTTFSGNIGTNSGSISGFTNQSNPLFRTQDALTSSCAAFLPSFFNTVKAIPATITNHAAAFGNGEILIPGVYSITTAGTIAGVLTLDGLNDSNSKFIFKIPGALALTAATEIKLINGAAASNVYWIMDGALAVGANSKLKGTFICEAGIVTIGAGCDIVGHVYTLAGAITVSNTTLTLTNSMILGASQSIAPGSLPANLIVTGNTTPIIKWQSSITANFNIATDIVNTTNTLTGASIGILPLTTYFRAVTTLEGAETGSNAAKITITTPTIAPNLGPTASFVLFTSSGAVTGDGTTTFTGNIGTNLGTIAGFANLSNPLFHTQNALTAACANYLPELFNNLKAIPTTATRPAAFTAGEIILPGVYQIPIASTMAGTITLDGGNDPNAVFIFKIPGAFALTAASNIKLINGTAASNVFWVIDGAFAAGANSILAGTFICEAGIVGIGAGCVLNGYVYNMSGAVTVTNSKLTLTNTMVLGASQSIAPGSLPANLIVTGNTTPIIKWQSSITADFNIATDIANTTNTLTGATIGVLSLSTYYRAVTILDGAETGSNAAKITILTASIAPNLGPTASFVLFTSAGAVTGAGINTFTGNIGTNFGAITGFANLSNPLFRTQDALTAGCANYLPELFNNLIAIPTTNTTHAAAFVTGEIVAPGVYQIASASTLAGIVTLDGGGNSNAVFIVKISGAFAITAAAEIKLINGASKSNVFWVIDGALAVGAGSKIAGNFICQLGILTIGSGCSVDGRVFTMGGAVTVANSNFTLSNSMVLTASQSIALGSLPADLVLTGNISPVIKWQSSINSTFTNPTDILRYTTLLSGSCIGPVFSTTFYRAVIMIDGFEAYSNHVTISIAGTGSAGLDMGAASPFVLFTSAGAVTEGGTTTTSLGKIGTAFGLLNAFPSSLSSVLHQEDALTFACRDYLPELFNTIKAYPTTNATHAAAFGGGETLLPGVYAVASAATMGGMLTLNGQNNPNALFVFKITGALALAAGTEIILTNGASASNVFWVVDGALALGATCIFKGTSISLAGAVEIGANSTVDGRIFTIAGAITLANCTFTFIPPNAPIIAVSDQVVTSGTQPSNITITGNTAPVVRWEKSSDIIFTTPVTIAITTTTLSGEEIGTLTATTYIRAVVVLDGATLYSTIVTLVVVSGSENTVAGVISANQMIDPDAIPANLTLTGNTGQVTKWQRSLTSDFAIATDINVNSTTLTGAEIGSLNVTSYFRAVVQNCTNAVLFTNTVTITVGITTTWNGSSWSNGLPSITKAVVFAANFTITENIDALFITVNNGAAVTINSGLTMTVINELNTTSGSLIFENNSNLIQNTAIANSGNIIVKRNSSLLKRLDYTLWSSPVIEQGLYAFSPLTFANRFYKYDTNTDLYDNSLGFNLTDLQYPAPLVAPNGVNGTDSNNVKFTTGKGYLIRAPWNHSTVATVWTGLFTGVPNNGDIAFPMTTGYNAVGNPYPSRINVHAFIDGNPNISGPLYLWRKTNDNNTTSYATLTKTAYVANGAEGGDTGTGFFNSGNETNWVINIGQGFIVNATSNTNLNFTNSIRRGLNTDQFFRTAQTANTTNNGLYWLNLTNSAGVYSQMAVGYSPEGTLAEDRGIDGKNINQEFYLTSLIGTNEYSIQGRPDFQNNDIVLLSYKAIIAGDYAISIDHAVGGFTSSNQPIYLKDNMTSLVHNLNTGAYNFSSAIGTFTNRFEIVYQAELGIDNPDFNINNVIIYNQNNNLIVKTDTIIIDSIKVFDISGRLLQERKNINTTHATLDLHLANQILLVKITSTNGLIVTKKVMQ
jgi:hypothetical protein